MPSNKEDVSLQPDFALLIYPVISFTEGLMHKGSRDLMLGKNPTEEQIERFLDGKQITAQMSPP